MKHMKLLVLETIKGTIMRCLILLVTMIKDPWLPFS
jgi:hypothetical protein